jgi:hypothetical protein
VISFFGLIKKLFIKEVPEVLYANKGAECRFVFARANLQDFLCDFVLPVVAVYDIANLVDHRWVVKQSVRVEPLH